MKSLCPLVYSKDEAAILEKLYINDRMVDLWAGTEQWVLA